MTSILKYVQKNNMEEAGSHSLYMIANPNDEKVCQLAEIQPLFRKYMKGPGKLKESQTPIKLITWYPKDGLPLFWCSLV